MIECRCIPSKYTITLLVFFLIALFIGKALYFANIVQPIPPTTITPDVELEKPEWQSPYIWLYKIDFDLPPELVSRGVGHKISIELNPLMKKLSNFGGSIVGYKNYDAYRANVRFNDDIVGLLSSPNNNETIPIRATDKYEDIAPYATGQTINGDDYFEFGYIDAGMISKTYVVVLKDDSSKNKPVIELTMSMGDLPESLQNLTGPLQEQQRWQFGELPLLFEKVVKSVRFAE